MWEKKQKQNVYKRREERLVRRSLNESVNLRRKEQEKRNKKKRCKRISFSSTQLELSCEICPSTTLTIQLTTLMNMEISEYNRFVTVLAAGLSERATHTYFEKDLMKNVEEKYVSLVESRGNLLVLMDILLTRMKVKKFLLERNNSNI